MPVSIIARTLSDRVFEIVRERIVTGELRGNMPIRQDALASELGQGTTVTVTIPYEDAPAD